MFYVYLIQSRSNPDQTYVGLTDDLKRRLVEHNTGQSRHTNKFKPWKIVVYVGFEDREKAENFETYLKHGSGHAFAKKHFW